MINIGILLQLCVALKKETMKNKLTELSLEELTQKSKTYKLITGMMIGLILFMAIIGIADYYNEKTFKFTQALPLFFIPLLISNFMNIKKITSEIDRRKE